MKEKDRRFAMRYVLHVFTVLALVVFAALAADGRWLGATMAMLCCGVFRLADDVLRYQERR